MAVLAEAFSVIIKKDSLKRNKRHYKQFLHNIADKKTVCDDGIIFRVGFMLYDDAINYLKYLRQGLELSSHTYDNKANDFVLIDMLNGPMVECDWLEFLRDKLFEDRTDFEKSNEDFSIVWHKDNYSGTSCSQTEGFSAEGICFPKLWTPDNAIYIIDKSNNTDNIEVLKEENGVTTLRNTLTGEITYVGRTNEEDDIVNSNQIDEIHNKRIEELFVDADKIYIIDKDIDKALIKYQEIIDYGINNIDEYYTDIFADEVYNRFDNGTNKYLDHERAYLLFELGAKNGSILSLYFWGGKNVYGEGNSPDLYLGLDMWKEVSNYGFHTASLVLSRFYSSEKESLFDIDKAVHYCEVAKYNNTEDAEEFLHELYNMQKTHSKKHLLNKRVEDLISSKYKIDEFYKLAESYLYGIVNNSDFEKAKQCYSDILDFELKYDIKEKVLNRFNNYIDDKFFNNPRGKLDIEISDLLFNLNWEYGCVKSQIARSRIYFYGKGRERDIPLAISMLEESSDFGDDISSLILIDIFKSNVYGLKQINKALNYCKNAIINGVVEAEILLLPLQIEKENSEFEDIIELFDSLQIKYQKFTPEFYKSLNEIIMIADRDLQNNDFIELFYTNVKNRIDYQLDKPKNEKYIRFIKYFSDQNSVLAKKDLAKTLFFGSKKKNKSYAIEVWENLANNNDFESFTYLLKILVDDTYGTKDVVKYFKYKKLYDFNFNPKELVKIQENPSVFKIIKGWIS